MLLHGKLHAAKPGEITANNHCSYTAIFQYARYYSLRHPKVVEDEKLLQHMLSIVGEQSGGREWENTVEAV